MAKRNWVKVESKRMDALDYDPLSRTLYVRYHPNKSGVQPEYAYANVEPPLFEKLMNAPSKGIFFNENIGNKKDEYPYQRLESEPVEEGNGTSS